MTDDDVEFHLRKDTTLAAAEGVMIIPWQLPADFIERSCSALAQLDERHHLHGAWVCGTEPVLLFRLGDKARLDVVINSEIRVVPWGWPSKFGAALTLTCHFIGSDTRCRVYVPNHERALLEQLRLGRFRTAFLRGHQPIVSFEVDFSNTNLSLRNLQAHVDGVLTGKPILFEDDAAYYWEVLECMTSLASEWTAADRLQLGWFKVYEDRASMLTRWLRQYHQRKPTLDAKGIVVPDVFQEFVELVFSPATDARVLLDHINKRFGTSGELSFFLRDQIFIGEHFVDDEEWEELFHFIGLLISTYILSPLASACGRQLLWYDCASHDFRKLVLEPHEFPPDFAPEEYWARLPDDEAHYGWGYALSGGGVPIAKQTLLDAVDSLPQADDLAAVDASANALFEEAMANKRGTIPRGAYVQLAFGPFTHVEMSEVGQNIMVTCRTRTDEALVVVCEPKENYCSFHFPSDESIPEDRVDRIEAGIKLLLAAIIRDFWVVEHRETVFDTRIAHEARERQVAEDGEARVVYIPRVRYSPKLDTDRCAETLNQPERRSHFVQAHVRRSKVASKYQIDLAARYGFAVPTGYTFVRPHERGKGKRDVIYRSRSALQSLYTALVEGPTVPSQWFQFERDVHKLMNSLGFTVEHIAAARRGDNGVDVFATKGTGLDEVQWIIQCKCWKPSRKVYPNTVRELIGVLAGYSHGVRGMIVTTSSFSSGAKETAKAANIMLMDGSEFSELLRNGQ